MPSLQDLSIGTNTHCSESEPAWPSDPNPNPSCALAASQHGCPEALRNLFDRSRIAAGKDWKQFGAV